MSGAGAARGDRRPFVNFLLHRHFALAELGSERAGVGAMLPDLWRLAGLRNGHGRRPGDEGPTSERPSRRAHGDGAAHGGDRPSLPETADASGITRDWIDARIDVALVHDAARTVADGLGSGELARGVQHHYDADRWFHATEVFRAGERRTAEVLRSCCNGSVPKLGLFAHVLWEMCLDGALLRREGLEASMAALRGAFAALDVAELAALGFSGDEQEPSAQREQRVRDRLALVLERLLGGGWLEAYCSGQGMCLPLGGVRSRLGLSFFTHEECALLAPALEELLRAAELALDALLVERAAHRAAR